MSNVSAVDVAEVRENGSLVSSGVPTMNMARSPAYHVSLVAMLNVAPMSVEAVGLLTTFGRCERHTTLVYAESGRTTHMVPADELPLVTVTD